MSKRYVVVDLETTGNSWKDGKDKITQIAAVVVEDGEILRFFRLLLTQRERSHHLLQN